MGLIDTFEYEFTRISMASGGSTIHIAGDVYATVYRGRGTGMAGWLVTFSVTPAGVFGAIIGQWEFNGGNIFAPEIIHIGGTTYAIIYEDFNIALNDGVIITTTINNDGTLGGAAIDNFNFGNPPGTEEANRATIIHCTGDIYAITYYDADNDRWIFTIDIDALGNIGAAIIDELEIEPVFSQGWGRMVPVSGTIYAIAYAGNGAYRGVLATVDIDALGNIGPAVIDTYQFSTLANQYSVNVFKVAGTVFGLTYIDDSGALSRGAIFTINIDALGNIAAVPISTGAFDVLADHTQLGFVTAVFSNNRLSYTYTEDTATVKNGKVGIAAITDAGVITVFIPESFTFVTVPIGDPLAIYGINRIDGYVDIVNFRWVDDDGYFASVLTGAIIVQTDPATEIK